jgi:two-component system OmpR family response regulator
MRILVVEDDVSLASRIGSELAAAGHVPIIAHDGERALKAATETSFDLIVLDIILPGANGFEVLRRLRSQHVASRVLIESACDDVSDRVTGLQLGADDYLPKPFAMRELVARVNALGRRYPEEPMLKLHAGDLTLDCVSHGGISPPAPHSIVRARPDVAENIHAGAGPRFHPLRAMRTRLGACA